MYNNSICDMINDYNNNFRMPLLIYDLCFVICDLKNITVHCLTDKVLN